jgi:hypothetical protein
LVALNTTGIEHKALPIKSSENSEQEGWKLASFFSVHNDRFALEVSCFWVSQT